MRINQEQIEMKIKAEQSKPSNPPLIKPEEIRK